MPTIKVNTANKRPKKVLGKRSPYPVVVIVTITSQAEFIIGPNLYKDPTPSLSIYDLHPHHISYDSLHFRCADDEAEVEDADDHDDADDVEGAVLEVGLDREHQVHLQVVATADAVRGTCVPGTEVPINA